MVVDKQEEYVVRKPKEGKGNHNNDKHFDDLRKIFHNES